MKVTRVFKLLFFIFFALFFISETAIGQRRIVDTLDSGNGKVLIYSNLTWEYLRDKNFDGILNPLMYEKLKEISDAKFFQSWNNSKCYTSSAGSKPSMLKDTLWLCLQDNNHENFVMPVPGIKTSSYGIRHGRNHNGVDLDLETGDTVLACWSGKVRYSKYNDGGFGNLVIIRHYNGLETFYAHLSKLLVYPNQEVLAGDPIGLGGNTGHSFGSHLHFEIRFFDVPFNPERIIDVKSKKIKSDNLFVHKSFFYGSSSPSSSRSTSSQQVSRSKKKYHKVRSGDTLSAIAARYHSSVSKICKLNRIKPTTILRIGKSLRVK